MHNVKLLDMNYFPGLGYSPAGGPPVGGYGYTPGPGFFGKQPMDSLLPRRRSFGSDYPLMNRPSAELNEAVFPRYPVGMGNTPGGDGGVWMQGMPGFQSYWGFGKKRRYRRRRRSRSRSHRSSKRRRTSKISS